MILKFHKFNESTVGPDSVELYNKYIDILKPYVDYFLTHWDMKILLNPSQGEFTETLKRYYVNKRNPSNSGFNNPDINYILDNDAGEYAKFIVEHSSDGPIIWLKLSFTSPVMTIGKDNQVEEREKLILKIIQSGGLLNLFRKSELEGYSTRLQVMIDINGRNIIADKTGKPNITVKNILSGLFEAKYYHEYTPTWFKLLIHFIRETDNSEIKLWWEKVKNDKQVFQIVNTIKQSEQWNKFESAIESDNLETAAKLGEIGF